MKYLITEEGRVVKSGANWIWEYNQTDHLGDVRTVVRRNATTGLADMVQDNHYFPFGMLMSDISTSSTDNRFRYNGKEYQNDLGFEWYDYGARFYDPALARWHSMDSEAENYYSMSPYNYVGNNPISRIDPDGNDWKDVVNGTVRGLSDNLLGTNIRASYQPNNADDYNDALTKADITSLMFGASETIIGGGATTGGIIAAPETFGASLAVSFAGAGAVAHGTMVTLARARLQRVCGKIISPG